MPTITITKAARQVSEIVGYRIAPSTVRSWCLVDLFAPFWSDDANPETGTTRRFTGHDLEILTKIATYRRQNLSYAEIAEKLAEPPEPDPEPEAAQTATDAPGAPIRRADVGEAAALVTTATARFDEHMTATNDRIDEIDRRLSRMETRAMLIAVLVAGFVVGATVAALVLLR